MVVQCDEYLSTEVKGEWVTLGLGWVTASVHYLCLSDGFAACSSRPKPPFDLALIPRLIV